MYLESVLAQDGLSIILPQHHSLSSWVKRPGLMSAEREVNDCERRTVDRLSMLLFFNHYRSPDNAKIKPKMLYASSKDGLRKALNGIAAEIQGTDYDEVAYETVLERIRR